MLKVKKSLFLKRCLGHLISHLLTFSLVYVILGIFNLIVCNFLHFKLDCAFGSDLVNVCVLKLMSHDHVHVIRREGAAAKLDVKEIVLDMLRQRPQSSFLFLLFLGLPKSLVDIAGSHAESFKLNGLLLAPVFRFDFVKLG